ncbi:Poly(A) RNA polymerase, mitochondrial [Amphibalanus amphitrite]|uniref:Poly(A) RNA polymerase, mitochondrial n=1 Tax=Amphibalanus amphitrite TaxID=1232801 RepID=A0A6A4VM61_AMPAM|nr:Poly(A) RNA polymerase, mitochondrial [Amphibalanus amphitrite]
MWDRARAVRNWDEFLFVEMSSPAEVEAVLQCACHPYQAEVVPVSSPLLWLRSGGPPQTAPKRALPPPVSGKLLTPAALCDEISACPTLDDQLLRHHELTRLTELGARLRYFTCELLERALAGLFPAARVRPFGSSANGFGRHDCDVDLILELAPEAAAQPSQRLAFQTLAAKKDSRTQVQRYLNFLADLLVSLMPGCSQVRRILKARVPIVKYTQSLTGVDCDLSMMRNGIHMTELLFIWSQLDTRVAPLVRAVRHWAEKVHLTTCVSGSGRFISNFGLTLLVIYFLQTRPVPLLPSVNELTQLARPGDTALVDGVSYTFLRDPSLVPVTANTESLSDLLAGFFDLYASLDLNAHALSVVWGGTFGHPGDAPLHVQNPLDLELNVTKNVSREEVCRLGGEASRAGRLLEEGRWWELLFGEGVRQPQVKPISVRQLFDEDEDGEKAVKEAPSPTVDAVRLANLLGDAGRGGGAGRDAAAAEQAGVSRRKGRGGSSDGSTPFSGLRLTVDGEVQGLERAPILATISAAAAAARQRKEAEQAAAAARDAHSASETVVVLDESSNKKPAKRKKKKKRSQAGS